jgi:hypothetical protein
VIDSLSLAGHPGKAFLLEPKGEVADRWPCLTFPVHSNPAKSLRLLIFPGNSKPVTHPTFPIQNLFQIEELNLVGNDNRGSGVFCFPFRKSAKGQLNLRIILWLEEITVDILSCLSCCKVLPCIVPMIIIFLKIELVGVVFGECLE